MNSNENQGKHVLFISELPDNINDFELHDFFKSYEQDILMIQIDRNQKMYDLFNTRKPKATIIFRTHEKAEEARNNLNMRRLKGKALNIMWHERDNSIRYNNKANIFVKGISINANPRDVYELFAKFGEIISCKICEDEDGNLLGYGYINYYNLDSAENAISNLNKTKFMDSELEVEHFQKKNERLQVPQENSSIYIKNIPNSHSKIDELKGVFSKFGKIVFAKIFQDNNERPYAIIVFADAESANKAKDEMNEKKLNEKDEVGLYVDLLQKRSERKRMLTTKIGDINNKLNQEYKNCNLFVKNLPYDLTEEKLKEIFSKCGEIKSVKISKFLLVTKISDKFVESETSRGFGFVCFTSEEGARKAKEEFKIEDESNIPPPDLYFPIGYIPKPSDNKEYDKKGLLINKDLSKPNNIMKHYRRIYHTGLEENRELKLRSPFTTCMVRRTNTTDTSDANNLFSSLGDGDNKIIKNYKPEDENKSYEERQRLKKRNKDKWRTKRLRGRKNEQDKNKNKEEVIPRNFKLSEYGRFKGVIRVTEKEKMDEYKKAIENFRSQDFGVLNQLKNFEKYEIRICSCII